MSKMFEAQVAVFTKQTQVGHLPLPDGFRFVIFTRGEKPIACPIAEAGTCTISLEALRMSGAGLPICVATVAEQNVAAWENLPPAAVDRMMDRVERGIGSAGSVLQ